MLGGESKGRVAAFWEGARPDDGEAGINEMPPGDLGHSRYGKISIFIPYLIDTHIDIYRCR